MNNICIQRPGCELCGKGFVIRGRVCEDCRQKADATTELLEALKTCASQLCMLHLGTLIDSQRAEWIREAENAARSAITKATGG